MQGSAAISSDAYFGREQRMGGGSASGSNLDMSAGDLISKVSITAKQDMDSLKQAGRGCIILQELLSCCRAYFCSTAPLL